MPRKNKNLSVPYCFCDEPASPSYSDEFGLLYECSNMNQLSSDVKVCCFHIHKEALDSFFDNSGRIRNAYEELKICPFFNLTYCAYFRTWNNHLMNGVQPKCTYHLFANITAFKKPQESYHPKHNRSVNENFINLINSSLYNNFKTVQNSPWYMQAEKNSQSKGSGSKLETEKVNRKPLDTSLENLY
ncbi:736_t:CDS:2 [Gigaspora margarita]|uniref:736_t:CDS:1 n=1 Tax=Gigaspora margarita TaxID=4874 RepID=A0ABN7WYT0_GIGMA|nr:736_t:CDS:2 [Gigaspora margarita]